MLFSVVTAFLTVSLSYASVASTSEQLSNLVKPEFALGASQIPAGHNSTLQVSEPQRDMSLASNPSISVTLEQLEYIVKLGITIGLAQRIPLESMQPAPVAETPKHRQKTSEEIDQFIMDCIRSARQQVDAERCHDVNVALNDEADSSYENDDSSESPEGEESVIVTFTNSSFQPQLKRKTSPVAKESPRPKKKFKGQSSNKKENKFKFVHRIPDTAAVYEHQFAYPARIAIFNLDKKVAHEALFDAFRRFGFIERLWIATDQTAHHENLAFIEFQTESSALDAVENMAGTIIGRLPVGVAMSPEIFDRSSRKLKITASKKTLALGSDHLHDHFSNEYLESQYGCCVYAFQATVGGMTPFGFALFNDEESARVAENDLVQKGFLVRREIC